MQIYNSTHRIRINRNIFILQENIINITASHSLSALSFMPVIAEGRAGLYLYGMNKENQCPSL